MHKEFNSAIKLKRNIYWIFWLVCTDLSRFLMVLEDTVFSVACWIIDVDESEAGSSYFLCWRYVRQYCIYFCQHRRLVASVRHKRRADLRFDYPASFRLIVRCLSNGDKCSYYARTHQSRRNQIRMAVMPQNLSFSSVSNQPDSQLELQIFIHWQPKTFSVSFSCWVKSYLRKKFPYNLRTPSWYVNVVRGILTIKNSSSSKCVFLFFSEAEQSNFYT